MIDPNDRFKFEWLDPRRKSDRTFFTGMTVAVAMAFAAFIVLGFLFLRSPKPQAPQEVKAEEELITIVMKSEVLTRALEENAADWCVVEDSRLFNGDMQLCSPDDEEGRQHYDRIMLRDSVAPIMAREYPHLFQWTDDGDSRTFQMACQDGTVTVPAWLVKKLIDEGVLSLP